MRNPIADLTRQEIFNIVYSGLKSQDFQRSHLKEDGCLYNGPNNTHCAMGWLLHHLSIDTGNIEGKCVSKTLWSMLDLDYPGKELNTFLSTLQSAHDDSDNPKDMESRLGRLAAKYGVEVPKEKSDTK